MKRSRSSRKGKGKKKLCRNSKGRFKKSGSAGKCFKPLYYSPAKGKKSYGRRKSHKKRSHKRRSYGRRK